MEKITEAILKTKNPTELNKLRILIVKEVPSQKIFEERQKAFNRRMANLKHTPKDKRGDWENPDFPDYYNPQIEQFDEIPDWPDRKLQATQQ